MNVKDKKYYSEYFNLIGSKINQLIDDFGFEKFNGNLGYNIQASAVRSF